MRTRSPQRLLFSAVAAALLAPTGAANAGPAAPLVSSTQTAISRVGDPGTAIPWCDRQTFYIRRQGVTIIISANGYDLRREMGDGYGTVDIFIDRAFIGTRSVSTYSGFVAKFDNLGSRVDVSLYKSNWAVCRAQVYV